MELSAERLARNETLFREANERLNDRHRSNVALREFVCECSDKTCTKTLLLWPGEYEAVRAVANRFMVARGHEIREIERVVFDNGRFLTVEKTVETEFMAETDPRSPE